MRKEGGFSLIELLVVVTVLGVIAAIAVPGLRAARNSAQSASAVQTLRMITTAQHLYHRKYKAYGTLADLNPEGTLDPTVASGDKSGYSFALSLGSDQKSYSCTATPQSGLSERPYFFVDETGVIRFNDGAAADASSQPIPR